MSVRLGPALLNFKDGVGATLVKVQATGNDAMSIVGASGERVRLTGADVDFRHVAKSANYTMLVTDVIVGVDTSGGAVTITLPLASNADNRMYYIVDEGGAAGTNNITVNRSGSDTISGAPTLSINTHYGRIVFYSNGSNWFLCT